jgi:galactan endo-1,6-beta-galactosidase
MTRWLQRLLVGLLACGPQVVLADYTAVIAPQTSHGVWDGWGVSLCWWANVFGYRNDLADLVFGTNYVSLNSQSLPGLGMNIARYNAGACSTNAIGAESIQLSPNIPPYRQMRGFWLDWTSSDPDSPSWNWTADTNQRAMLLKARARGANLFELFSNSPMWWMCYNHNPSGSSDGTSDNLQSWNWSAHAVYLATIAAYARTNWGVTFDSVEPFNEPSASWWKSTGTQEGGHFAVATQDAVIRNLRAELDARGLGQVRVAASDEYGFDDARSTWTGLSSAARASVGRVNTHGYQYGGGRRDLLYAVVAGKRLWVSEYGEGDASGLSLATNLSLDFTWLHMTGWCYWQPLDSGGWGLVQSNPGDNWIGTANPKFFVLAQYTRHVRPGMTIIGSGDGNTVAAYDTVRHKLVLVTVNAGPAQSVTFDLSAFPSVTGPVRRWITLTGAGDKYRAYQDLAMSGNLLRASFPSNSVQTIEVQNVDAGLPRTTLKGGRLELSWPTALSAWKIYSAPSPGSASWSPVAGSPRTNQGWLTLEQQATNASPVFYRLSP